jgi:hypothetical protein
MKTPFGATLLLACVAAPFTPALPADLHGAAPLAALPAPSHEPWREAYARLVQRADRGDADSARLALEMFRHAPRVYGGRLDATPQQLQRWQCRAAGREPPCAEERAA